MRSMITNTLTFAALAAASCVGGLGTDGADGAETAATTEALSGPGLAGVPAANAKAPGLSAANVLSPELVEAAVAQGATPVENPVAGSTTHYGYDGDGPFLPAFGSAAEASKTEPDKNTYLVLDEQQGADPGYDYGRHFLFQGHEAGTAGAITRINLDADAAHRVTRLASTDAQGAPLPAIDGSTWDPWAKRLLFTSEEGAAGGVWQATLAFPSSVEALAGSIGRGGYEGIQNDRDGNVWIVEDSGGPTGATARHAKQPNSFVYRFVPASPDDLSRGQLQALQVVSLRTGAPIAFHAGAADADILSADVGDLHTYGKAFATHWVTLHDTATDGTAPFDANALAKARLATPFKRPENGQFRPGSDFRQFFFDETGDTNALTEAGAGHGGFGAILELDQASPSACDGTLRVFYVGDAAHTGLDNVAFLDRDHVVFVEDAGDTLHTQRNAYDSAFVFDVRRDYSRSSNQPVRMLALGRDASATIDAGLAGQPGFQNEGDNEITGIHVSDGDPRRAGILGAKLPHAFDGGWRVFYTQQHGDNVTWEILARRD